MSNKRCQKCYLVSPCVERAQVINVFKNLCDLCLQEIFCSQQLRDAHRAADILASEYEAAVVSLHWSHTGATSPVEVKRKHLEAIRQLEDLFLRMVDNE